MSSQNEYQAIPDDERVARLDYLVAAINWYVVDPSEKEEADLKAYLGRLRSEAQAWLETLEARAVR